MPATKSASAIPPACRAAASAPSARKAAVSPSYCGATSATAASAGTSSRNRPGTAAKTTTAETTIATAPPLLWVLSQPASIADGESEREGADGGIDCRAARRGRARARARSRKKAACAFTYDTGAVSRPST